MRSDRKRKRDERRRKSEANVPIRLPSLIAPKYFAGEDPSAQGRDRQFGGSLPSLKDLGILKAGRGVYPQPPVHDRSQSDPGPPREFQYQGRRLQEYWVYDSDKNKNKIDITCVMQVPAGPEGETRFTCMNEAGRTITYKLDVAQPPKQARACGNGPRSSADRRPIDPPPVIKLSVFDGSTDVTGYYEANFMLYASLEFARPIANNNIYTTNHCPVLTGTNCAGAAYLTKPANAIYFIFPDLSVRHEGFYRLKFHLFEQNKPQPSVIAMPGVSGQTEPEFTPIRQSENMVNRTSVYSPPFQVFSAKKFPGLENSTPLSMIMSEQGCRVRIRREVRQRRHDPKNGHKEDDQRSLRAASRDRVGSVDTQDNYSRSHYAPDTRRPSIDSQYSLARQSIILESAIASPLAAGPPTQYGSNLVSEPQNMWSAGYRSTNMPPAHSLPSPVALPGQMPPPVARPSYPPVSPTVGGPSIASLLTPTEPQRPAGGLYDTEPVNKKRALNRSSEERDAGLKDHARPSTERSTTYPKVYGGSTSASSHAPLASVNTVIEADPNEDSTDENESDLEDANSYRRANGTRNFMSRIHHR